MSKKNLDEFCQRHSIKCIDSSKRAHKLTRMNTKYFNYATDYNMIDRIADVALETETLYTLEVSESELERIADFESQVFNNLHEKGHYNMFETLMEQKEQEKFLRDRYPAVKKAYEQYSLMLKLAQSGEI